MESCRTRHIRLNRITCGRKIVFKPIAIETLARLDISDDSSETTTIRILRDNFACIINIVDIACRITDDASCKLKVSDDIASVI